MVLGAIRYHFKSKLVLCVKYENEIEYRDIFIKSGICETLDPIFGPGNYIYIQERATSHTTNNSKLLLQKHGSFLH